MIQNPKWFSHMGVFPFLHHINSLVESHHYLQLYRNGITVKDRLRSRRI